MLCTGLVEFSQVCFRDRLGDRRREVGLAGRVREQGTVGRVGEEGRLDEDGRAFGRGQYGECGGFDASVGGMKAADDRVLDAPG